MAKPIPYFNFKVTGLTVDFLNKTVNNFDTCLWDFGFMIGGIEQTSTNVNPTGVIFPNSGLFQISLSCTNSDGTALFSFSISLSNSPSLDITISEMVMAELPVGVSINSIYYGQLLKKWQLYLQKSQSISDTDVFDESKWSVMANVLIAKLIINDLMILNQKNVISSLQRYGMSLENNLINGTYSQLLSDYSIFFDLTTPKKINYIIINSTQVSGNGTYYSNPTDLVNWLNTLSDGNFSLSGNLIVSISNPNSLSIINYSAQGDAGVYEVLFNQTNQRISSGSNLIATSKTKGPVKQIVTGPSSAEWYDLSQYWLNIMKSGIMDSIKNDVCMYARIVGVKLYFCRQIKTTQPFIVGKNCN